ncbi:hypothetical protein D3C78_1454820 [compost metagenome]
MQAIGHQVAAVELVVRRMVVRIIGNARVTPLDTHAREPLQGGIEVDLPVIIRQERRSL